MRRALPLVVAALLASAASGAADPFDVSGSFVLRNVRIEVGDGSVVEAAAVVVRDGKVEAAGPEASLPAAEGLPVVDGRGGTVFPGFVLAATRLGLPPAPGAADRPTPTESVTEELPPFHPLFRVAAREGVAIAGVVPGPGAPGGECVAVRPAAAGTPAFLLAGGRGLRIDVDPSTGWSKALAQVLDAAKRENDADAKADREEEAWRAATAEWKARGSVAGKAPAEPKRPTPEPRTAIVRDALRRKASVVVFAGSASDVERALDALAPHRVRLVLRASGDAWRAAGRAAGAGATVVLEPILAEEPGVSIHVVRQPRMNPAAVFEAAGCPVAFVPREESRRGLDSLLADVGLLARCGLGRRTAVRGLALEGARALGLEAEAGTVAAGRSADLLLFDGDPLEPTSRLVAAWNAGRKVPDAAVPVVERKP
jgi:imidazolonepropionase-like amidohydrolase